MKKIFALLMVLAMVFAMAACGGQETVSLVGTWKGTINGMDNFAEGFDAQFQSAHSIKDYVKEMPIGVNLTFTEDGKYNATMSFDGSGDELRAGIVAFMRDVLTEMNSGVALTDEEITAALGMDLETYVAVNMDDDMLAQAFSAGTLSGTYTNEKGTVKLDDGTTGTLNGSTLTLNLAGIGSVEFTK